MVYYSTESWFSYSQNGNEITGVNKKNLKYALIKEGVKKINSRVFENCVDLHTVILPQSLEIIEQEAFSGCVNLRWINFPCSLKFIGTWAFKDCINLKVVDLSNTHLENILGMAFNQSGIEYLSLPITTKIESGESISEIPHLKYLTVYKNVKEDKPDYIRPDVMYNTFNTPFFSIVNYDEDGNCPKSKNGVLLDWYYPEVQDTDYEEPDPLLSAIMVPLCCNSIPEDVNHLGSYCLLTINKQDRCPFLYIPESVIEIDTDTFDSISLNIVVKRKYARKIESILPPNAKDFKIFVI